MRLEGQNTNVRGSTLARLPARRRLRGDDGSIIAESALLTPFFVLLLFGMLEFGGAFRDYLTLSNAASAGARTAAIEGNSASADWNTILAIKDGASAMPMSQITRIVIYKASSPTAAMPAGCATASSAINHCNSFDKATIATVLPSATMPISWANCTGPTAGYCPTPTVGTGRSVTAAESRLPGGVGADRPSVDHRPVRLVADHDADLHHPPRAADAVMTVTVEPTPVKRFHGDDGSVIAEMALVAPLLVMLMLGVFEFGTAWRNKTILSSSLRSAARIESQGTLNTKIDQIALGALYAGNSKMVNMTLVKVIIYEATNAAGQPAANCLSRSATGNTTKGVKNALGVQSCSIYSAAQVATAATGGGSFGSCTDSNSWDYNYCSGPASVTDPRNNTMNGGPDYVGIYAEYTYDTVTGLLPQNNLTISDYSVYRIEPAV